MPTDTHTISSGLGSIHAKGATPKYYGHFLSIIGHDGKVSMITMQALMEAQRKVVKLWRGWYCHGGEGFIRARNECAYRFLNQSDCAYHLLMDNDIAASADHIQSLRRHPEAEEHIICGVYFKKSNRIEACYNSLKGGNPEPNAQGLIEVATAGTGFMQIPRAAYQKIIAAFPDRWYSCDYLIHPDGSREKKYSFFFQDVYLDENSGMRRDMTEDWSFCDLARKAGVKIYLDTSTAEGPPVQHLGAAFYPLQVEQERLILEDQLKEAQEKIKALEAKQTD